MHCQHVCGKYLSPKVASKTVSYFYDIFYVIKSSRKFFKTNQVFNIFICFNKIVKMEMEITQQIKYFIYDEVVTHNKEQDFWIILHGNVLNLSPFIKDRADHWNFHMEYLLAFGGKDLSYLFHKNGDPKTEISNITGKPRVLFPPILETARSDIQKTPCKLWSQDSFYVIGRLTSRERRLRIINTLTGTTQYMKVCDEDTIYEIQKKYKTRYNNHAGSYLWFKNNGKKKYALELNKTLDENGLTECKDSGIELPPPAIWLYYTDDLTVA